MTHMQDDEQYRITDEDIEKVINLLKLTNASKATPEYARRILEQLYQRYHVLKHIDPDAIEEIMKDLEEY
jgi:geranylgeranyl pyrophosphate synthase